MEIRVLGPNGNIGTGFKEESFERGIKLNPHVIACDAGSTDSGAYALGTGIAKPARSAIKRDTRLILLGRDELKVPLIIGSCGTSGSDVAVDWMRDIVIEIAKEENLHFKIALIKADQDKTYLKQKLGEGKIKPLFPEFEYTEETINKSARIVGVMGYEQLNRALSEGADVILAGRATDTSLFAVVPLRMGADPGLTWHMAKTIECGAACAVVPAADSMFVRIRDTEFEVEPLDLDLKVTPLTIAAHTLYENLSPFEIREPEGTIVTENCEYQAKDNRSVIVKGSEFRKETYTIKLEGAELVGYQTVIIGGIRDPYIIKQLDSLFKLADAYFGEKVPKMFPGLKKDDFSIHFRVYGKNGVMGPMEPLKDQVGHEVGLLITITAQSQELATEISKFVAHISAHLPIPEWEGIISTIAYPFSPPEIEKGPVYRFNVNHVVEPDDPFEMFRFSYEEV
ncbi:MAG: acyclic terpene utilization AtuA family protein [Candidatus Lokiarchaeota archaeon]|nr:acyclic terpene utilization AtuA family protein [Candidatus Lokiarchaeota archaeon]